MIEALTEPFAQGLMQRALVEVLLLAVVGGTLGCWVVLGGLPYAAESLSHGLLPGLVIAALIGAPLLLGAAMGAVVAALAIAAAARAPGVGHDEAVAVAVTALVGLGALLALTPAAPLRLEALLFGDVLATTTGDLLAAGALAAAALVVLRLTHWRLLAVAFDRGGARALGVSPAAADVALLALLAVAVLVAVQGLGSLLAVAVLVAPAATARALTRRLPATIALAIALGAAAGIAGLCLSYYARVAAGAAIAGVLVAGYLVVRATVALRAPRLPSTHALPHP